MILSAPSPRRMMRALAFTLMTLATLLGLAAPAQAHDELLSSNPEANAIVEVAPEEISLRYSGEIMDIGNQVRVTNADGEQVGKGNVLVKGMTVTQPLAIKDLQADDTYTVKWRVVSSDGHPIQGVYTFTVGKGKEIATPTASASTSAVSVSPTDKTGFNATNIAIVLVASAAVLALLVTVLVKNRKK